MANIDEHLPNDSSLQMYGQKNERGICYQSSSWRNGLGWHQLGVDPLEQHIWGKTIILVLGLALAWGQRGEFHPKSVA